MKKLKGQILIITLLVLTILSILTVSLVILNNRDITQTVNSEIYEKIYNSSETKLKEVLGLMASPTIPLSTLTTQYGSKCAIVAAAVETYECNFTLCPDSDPLCNTATSPITYSAKINVSNEKDIIAYPLNKDRPLTLNLDGYASAIRIIINKDTALDFTLIYEQAGVYKTFSGVYDPTSGTYNSTDPVFKTYFTPTIANPLAFVFRLPAAYNNFKLLSITPRLRTASDSILISVIPQTPASYPVQIRRFTSQSFSTNVADSPTVKIISQIPLEPQMDGLLDYALITEDSVDISD